VPYRSGPMTSPDPPTASDRRRLTVAGRGWGGEGYARVEEGFVSLHHTEPGDVVEATLGPFVRGRTWGVVERWVERAPSHADPACEAYATCSGCALRHISPEAERALAVANLREVLGRYGPDGAEYLVPDWVLAGSRDGHRVRGRFRVEVGADGALRVGLRAIGVAEGIGLADIPRCPAQSQRFLELLAAVRAVLEEARAEGTVAAVAAVEAVAIDAPAPPSSARVEVVASAPLPADLLQRLRRLADWAPDGIGVGVARGDDYTHIAGPEVVRHDLGAPGPTAFVAAPRASWTPTNPDATRVAAAWAVDTLGDLRGAVVVEVGAGIGFGTAALVRAGAARVHAVDREHLGLRALQATCDAAGWPVVTRAGLAHTVLRRLRSDHRADAALVNPMREPLGARVLEELAAFGVTRVAYLGPSAVSAARDARTLVELGFRLVRAAAIAQHPGTAQVMAGLLLVRPAPDQSSGA
jgi:23S rRNA (uracil1939-C5)-methyltransferase